MSKVGNNPIMKTVSGKLGNVVVYRRVQGRLLMCNTPKKRELFSPKQQAQKELFAEAVAYAKAQIDDEAHKAEYATGINERLTSAYAVALTDYLKAPEIRSIDASGYEGAIGDVIQVKAVDDFKVTAVEVEIRKADDTLIEIGDATLQPNSPFMWSYTTTKQNAILAGTKIIARAKDKPGNVTELAQQLI